MSDFLFTDHGSVTVLVPLSPAGRDWVSDHLPADAMQWGRGVVIEPRYADDILAGIDEAGLGVTS